MTTYAIIDGTGIVINFVTGQRQGDAYIDLTDIKPKPQIGWVYNGATFAEHHDPLPPENYHISRVAFIDRFTPAEFVALDLASLDDPAAEINERTNSAELRLFLARIAASYYIDLASDRIILDVTMLAGLDVLTEERANQILHDPILDSERPLS